MPAHDEQQHSSSSVEQIYPNLARWVKTHGWVEIGPVDYLRSFVRALDEGDMVWEGAETYPTLDDALSALDAGIHEFMRDQVHRTLNSLSRVA
ncbi:MAG TPA: hypothetical protein VLJ14_04630 [Ktedonobacterales bacterium]|jgi:hypothetical protein|nr:hypothetical protein [Ktedonobacterales bacterium]